MKIMTFKNRTHGCQFLPQKLKGLVVQISREITQAWGKTFSNYKSFNTSKLMVNIVSHGHIMCILVGFG